MTLEEIAYKIKEGIDNVGPSYQTKEEEVVITKVNDVLKYLQLWRSVSGKYIATKGWLRTKNTEGFKDILFDKYWIVLVEGGGPKPPVFIKLNNIYDAFTYKFTGTLRAYEPALAHHYFVGFDPDTSKRYLESRKLVKEEEELDYTVFCSLKDYAALLAFKGNKYDDLPDEFKAILDYKIGELLSKYYHQYPSLFEQTKERVLGGY